MSTPPIVSATGVVARSRTWGSGSTSLPRAHSAAANPAMLFEAAVPAAAPSRSSPTFLGLDGSRGAPAPGALERLPARAVRVGDARWFTCPPATPPPLAFYGTLEGRTGYFEIDLRACRADLVLDVLRQTRTVLAVQLPEQGMTPAMLQLLTKRCRQLECLRLPGKSSIPAVDIARFLTAVEEPLQALALGGRLEVFDSPQLAAVAVPAIKRMARLKYLDLCDGAASWQPSTREVKAMLADKQLRGFSIAGNMQVDCAALLAHPALQDVECLDLRRCTPQHGLFTSASKRLVSAVSQLRHLRVLQLPPLPVWEDDARHLERLKAWGIAQDLAFMRLGQGTAPVMIFDRREDAALTAAYNLPSEARLQTFAKWDPHFAEVGRWIPPPRERWESIDLCKRGAVYILREVAALRGLGIEAQVVEHNLEVEVTGPAYRLRWTLDTGHTFCVTVRPDELHAALERLPVAKQLTRQGGLASVTWLTASATSAQLAQAEFNALTRTH